MRAGANNRLHPTAGAADANRVIAGLGPPQVKRGVRPTREARGAPAEEAPSMNASAKAGDALAGVPHFPPVAQRLDIIRPSSNGHESQPPASIILMSKTSNFIALIRHRKQPPKACSCVQQSGRQPA